MSRRVIVALFKFALTLFIWDMHLKTVCKDKLGKNVPRKPENNRIDCAVSIYNRRHDFFYEVKHTELYLYITTW